MIVDVHVHTSNREMHGLHTKDASIGAIDEACDQYQIARALVIATYFPYKGRGVPNLEMLDRIHGKSRFALIASLDAMNKFEEGFDELEWLAQEKRLVGIKLFAGYQTFRVSEQKMFPIYALAEQYGLPVTIHGGELHHCCPKSQRESGDLKCKNSFCWIDRNADLARPAAFERAIRLFPRTNFVIAHLANPFFNELRELMTTYRNVYTDTSGQFLSGTAEASEEYKSLIVKELQQFLQVPDGDRRILFGSDFPIQSFADSIELIDRLELSPERRERVMWRNANQLFRLGLKQKRRMR